MSQHQWQGRPIADLAHHHDLERDSSALEFGASKLGRKEAEQAAYDGYKRKLHTEAAKHHMKNMRDALRSGSRDEGEKHQALYSLHMKAMGLNPSAQALPGSNDQNDFKQYAHFQSHPADHLLVSGMKKSDRETFFKHVDSDEVYLSAPGENDELSKGLRSPLALEQLHGQKVKVYFNLHNRLFSVQHGGRVVAHLPEVGLENVKFKVSESGRQRVLNEQRKNVHAFVEGTFQHKPEGHEHLPQGVTYNPYKHSTFVRTHDKSAITSATHATLKNLPHPMITVNENQTPESDPSFIHKRGQTE